MYELSNVLHIIIIEHSIFGEREKVKKSEKYEYQLQIDVFNQSLVLFVRRQCVCVREDGCSELRKSVRFMFAPSIFQFADRVKKFVVAAKR